MACNSVVDSGTVRAWAGLGTALAEAVLTLRIGLVRGAEMSLEGVWGVGIRLAKDVDRVGGAPLVSKATVVALGDSKASDAFFWSD